ncbi:unnamed protein product [Peronospora farinosa]|uniref:Uncharacterized protein n=1 Tax=Peronospora farinosa TaxID=134698 RepID=A0ABN8CBT6_9STRA|nr:unnamed protein product [Peronospora farinosa]
MFSCYDISKTCSTDQVVMLFLVVDVVDMTQLKTKTDSSIEKSGRGERVAMLLKIFLTLKNKESVESVEGSSHGIRLLTVRTLRM